MCGGSHFLPGCAISGEAGSRETAQNARTDANNCQMWGISQRPESAAFTEDRQFQGGSVGSPGVGSTEGCCSHATVRFSTRSCVHNSLSHQCTQALTTVEDQSPHGFGSWTAATDQPVRQHPNCQPPWNLGFKLSDQIRSAAGTCASCPQAWRGFMHPVTLLEVTCRAVLPTAHGK